MNGVSLSDKVRLCQVINSLRIIAGWPFIDVRTPQCIYFVNYRLMIYCKKALKKLLLYGFIKQAVFYNFNFFHD